METVLNNKIYKLFSNLEKTSYSNPFMSPMVLRIAKKLNIRLVPKSKGYDGCFPLGFYGNKMCEIILQNTKIELTDEQKTHLNRLKHSWNMNPNLIYVNESNGNIVFIDEYTNTNKKRKRLIFAFFT
jgi:hypothetical protein